MIGRTIDVPGIGPVLFRRDKRARRVTISVSAVRGVRATVPNNHSYANAERAVLTHKEWIAKTLRRMKRGEKDRQALQRKFDEIGNDAAKEILIARLRQLADEYGFQYNKVSVRNQRTRWGSCGPGNNISLNIKLVCLPDELRDYVIIHELVHTRIHNHGPKFHAELDKYVGDGRLLSRRLRKIGLQLL